MSVRIVRKKFVRATFYSERHEAESATVLIERLRVLSCARVIEDEIEKSVYFNVYEGGFPADKFGSQEGQTYGRRGFLKPVDKLLRCADTKFIQGQLLEGDELIFYAYVVSEKSFVAPCLSFPLGDKYVAQKIVPMANEFHGEDRFGFALSIKARKWCLFVNEIPEGAESKKRRDNDLFWAKLRFA